MNRTWNYYKKTLERNQISNETIEKSFYLLNVIFHEITKILVLLIIFALIGKVEAFLILFISVFLLRTNLGGIHFSTQKSCLGASIIIFSLMILLSNYAIFPDFYGIILAIVSSFVIRKLAPISSKQRPCYSAIQKKKFKIRGIIVVNCLSLFVFLQPQFKNYILWAITIQITEAVLVVVLQKGGSNDVKGICTENQ